MRIRPLALCLTLVATSIGFAATDAPVAALDVATQTCTGFPSGPTVAADSLAAFEAITPRRLVDTRDGLGGVNVPVGAGCTLRLDIDAASVPSDAGAVALSVTALGSKPGFLSVFPCSDGVPGTSNINTRDRGFPTPNLVVAIPDASRDVCIYSLFEANVIVDLTGWWTDSAGSRLTTIPPVRVDDSRASGTLWPANTARSIPLADYLPKGATAVVANLTVADSTQDGFITAYPCGVAAPNASNLNFRASEARAVAIVVGVGAATSVCVQSNVDVSVILDVSGYYSPAPQFGPTPGFQPLAGRRLADSRSGEGGWTSKFGGGTVRRLTPTAGLGNHDQSTAVVVNVIATQADGPGFITVYPCAAEVPNSSAVNYKPGGESTNMVVVDLSASGEICVYALTGVHVIVDLFGVVVADSDMLTERFAFDAYTWPPFTADGTDYVVECTPGANDLHLDLLRSVTARVNGVPVTSGTLDLPFGTDDQIRVELRRGANVRSYYFRCVPPDFPRLAVERPGAPAAGWYITTLTPPNGTAMYAVILDSRGAPVWYKRVGGDFIDLRRRSDGRLLLMPNLGPRYGVIPNRGYLELSLAGTLIAEHKTVADPEEPGVVFPTDHHDLVSLADGGRAMLSYPLLQHQDLRVLGPGYLQDDTIADGVIQEIAAGNTLRWRWRTSDYFGYDEVPYPIRWGPLAGYNGNEVDVFHLNSLQQVEDGTGDYVVSARHLDAVFRVDRATGAVRWVLGSLPLAAPNKGSKPRLRIVGDPLGGPRRMHDARQVGDVVTMYDNRTDTGQPARAVAYRIDEVARTATMIWQISEPDGRASMGLGSNRPTPSGSVLVAWGAGIQPLFGEFQLNGTPLLEMTQVGGGASYRIAKEPSTAFSAVVLRANAGGSIELP
ncbi:MAG: aryl-sulfate sulfotransferase [Ilumatobacteraceae bacterium]